MLNILSILEVRRLQVQVGLSGNAQIAVGCRSLAACPALEMMTVFAVLKFGVPWDPLEFAGIPPSPRVCRSIFAKTGGIIPANEKVFFCIQFLSSKQTPGEWMCVCV